MGFSLSKPFKKIAGFADMATGGIFTGGLTDGTIMSSILEKAGLKPGEGPDLTGVASAAEAAEKIKLFKLKEEKRKEARFLATEGQGLRREATLSFGSGDSATRPDEVSAAATGRFKENRLVL